jgi:hypothetical protein
MYRVKVTFDISPVFQKFTFLKSESVTAYKNVSGKLCTKYGTLKNTLVSITPLGT